MPTFEEHIIACKNTIRRYLSENRLNISYVRRPGKQPHINPSVTAGQLSAIRNILNKTDGSIHPEFAILMANECIRSENLSIDKYNQIHPKIDHKERIEQFQFDKGHPKKECIEQFQSIKNQWLVRRMKPIGVVVSFVDDNGNYMIGYDFDKSHFNKHRSIRKAIVNANLMTDSDVFNNIPNSMKYAVKDMVEKVNSFQEA